GCLHLGLVLDGEKEESVVAAVIDVRDIHRTSQGAAELISLQSVGGSGEEAQSVDRRVAMEFEERAMQGIGAGARDCVDNAAGVTAVLRAEAVGLHAEFLQRVGIG